MQTSADGWLGLRSARRRYSSGSGSSTMTAVTPGGVSSPSRGGARASLPDTSVIVALPRTSGGLSLLPVFDSVPASFATLPATARRSLAPGRPRDSALVVPPPPPPRYVVVFPVPTTNGGRLLGGCRGSFRFPVGPRPASCLTGCCSVLPAGGFAGVFRGGAAR